MTATIERPEERWPPLPPTWRVVRADALFSYRREIVAAEALDGEAVVHYSIPALSAAGEAAVEDGATIASSKFRIRGDEVLVSKLNPRKAHVFLPEAHAGVAVCSTEFVPLVPKEGVDRRFGYYLYLSTAVRERISATVQSATRSHQRANPDQIYKVWVPFPPLRDQRAIADFLDKKTAAIDALIAKKERLIGLIEEKRQAAITRAVTEGLDPDVPMKDSGVEWLGEVPTHWRVVQVRRAISESTYGISETLEPDGCVPVLRMGNISRGAVVLDDLKYVERVDRDLLLRSGDLLFNRTNSLELVGRTGLYRAEGLKHVTFASYLVRFRTNEHADPEYLNYLLNIPAMLQVARAMAIPSIGQANLSPSRYADLRICLPPRDEQRRIGSYIADRDRPAERVKSLLTDHVLKLKQYRQALISSAVTGQIDVDSMAQSASPHLEEALA